MGSVYIRIAVSRNPLFDICKERFIAVVVTVGEHVQRRMTAALRLPQVVAPVISAINFVNNHCLFAVCSIKPIGTTSCNYEYILVFRFNSGIFIQHFLCLYQLTMQVCSPFRKSFHIGKLFFNHLFIIIFCKNRFRTIQIQNNLLTFLKRNDADFNVFVFISAFKQRSKYIDC